MTKEYHLGLQCECGKWIGLEIVSKGAKDMREVCPEMPKETDPPRKTCIWTWDKLLKSYQTACGTLWYMPGGKAAHNYCYCPICGGKIIQ